MTVRAGFARLANVDLSHAIDRLRDEVPKGRVTVVVPDATRPLSPERVLSPLLQALGTSERRFTVVVGLGLHRPLTPSEAAPYRASAAGVGATIVEHDPDRVVTLRDDAGGLARPLPARVARECRDADALVCVGVVEPHQYAGFSGGAKGIAVGCGGRDTIAGLHGLELLRDPDTALGVRPGNRFLAATRRLVEALPPRFGLQRVPGGGVFAGPLLEAHDAAMDHAEAIAFEAWPDPVDAVRVRVPPSKGQSFYQASRAATYVALVGRSVVRPGGAVILEAPCPEGLGIGAGERAFARTLGLGLERLHAELTTSDRPLAGGEQRAFVLARTLARARIAVVGAPEMPELARVGILQAPTIGGAARALGLAGPPVAVAEPFRAVPRLEPTPGRSGVAFAG